MSDADALRGSIEALRLFSPAELTRAAEEAGDDSVELLTRLVVIKPGERARLGRLWGDMQGVAYVEISDTLIQPEALARVPRSFAEEMCLIPLYEIDNALLLPLVSRFKILAGADIAERRLPQDGRIRMDLKQRSLDLRFSSIPTLYGEKIVLRLLGQSATRGIPGLATLDFSLPILDGIRHVCGSPSGIFFITGPTGSGKTTTLYSILQTINRPETNILTKDI